MPNTPAQNAEMYHWLTEAEARRDDATLPSSTRADAQMTIDLILFRMEVGDLTRDQLRHDYDATRPNS